MPLGDSGGQPETSVPGAKQAVSQPQVRPVFPEWCVQSAVASGRDGRI